LDVGGSGNISESSWVSRGLGSGVDERTLPPLNSMLRELEGLVENDVPFTSDYEWVKIVVHEYFSKYLWSSILQSFASRVDILDDNVLDNIVSLCCVKQPTLFFRGKKIQSMTFFIFIIVL